MVGQDVTGRATKYKLARWLLTGRALPGFNNTTTLNSNKSLANYAKCIKAVSLVVFPRNLCWTRNVGWDTFWRNPKACCCKIILPSWLRSTIISPNPPSHCSQEFYQDTRQQATRYTRVQYPQQVAAANAGSKLQTNCQNIARLPRLLQMSRVCPWRISYQ